MSTTVFRIEKNREFVVMSNKFLRNKEMSLKAKGLLALCLSLPESWNYSLNGLVAICKESHTSIRSTLKELEEHNHLIRNRKQDEKGQFVYEYIIFEVPHTGNLHTAELYTDNPNTENNTQESINQLSKEEVIIEDNIYISEYENIIQNSVPNKNIQELYRQYIEMRKSINSPLTERGLKMLITRCGNLSHKNMNVEKLLLENAIINQWKNVYRPSEQEVQAALNAELVDKKSFYGI